MNTWWVRDCGEMYTLYTTGLKLGVNNPVGELYRHHKGWRVVPWYTEGRGVNLPDMPLKEAKHIARFLILGGGNE